MPDAVTRTVRAIIERDPTAFAVAQRDGRGHVLAALWHPDFTLGFENLDLRQAFASMPTHERRVWLAVNIGWYLDVEIIDGVAHPVERYGEPMSIEDCAEYYGLAEATVKSYLSRATALLSAKLSIPRSRARPPAIPVPGKGK
jgi:DNA-directed RNA polymerase specialized sigma24 family protein